MFRFWASDSRGSEKTVEAPAPLAEFVKPLHSSYLHGATTTITPIDVPSHKRRRQDDDVEDNSPASTMPTKRARIEDETLDAVAPPCDKLAHSANATDNLDRARDEIQHHFSLEILLKHDELRFINQELAKCQIALEQLRRCHLIPYPINCPTPDQMLDISAGKGPALQSRNGQPVPRWAPPFGVVDGPYARHYAKWLIPDPKFDGIQPEWQFTPEASRARSSYMEGRTTRNSFTEAGGLKGRPVRGMGGQKFQSLSSGYPQPKEKAGPCILKRSDGKTVKLVCIDCNRENFSSTQGFINHCRIAHKRDFKSHEEAAVHSGHPIEVTEGGGAAGEEKTPSVPPPPPSCTSVLIHPFARPEMTEQEAFVSLRSRINDSLQLFHQGKLPGVARIPTLRGNEKHLAESRTQNSKAALASPETPHLSRLLQNRNFDGNLRDLVTDAKMKISFDDLTPGEESEFCDASTPDSSDAKHPPAARTPVVMRVPARAPEPPIPTGRPTSSKGRAAMSIVTPPSSAIGMGARRSSNSILSDEDLDMDDVELSPNTMVSNNAPSLVSDDGEYDDSDDGSSVSGASDNLDADSVSDVAEINLDDDQDPRSLRRGSSGVSGAVRLRKDESKHVTFMSPVKPTTKDRRSRKI